MEHPIRAQYSKTDISTAWPIPSIWKSALEMGGLRAFSHDPEPEFVHQMHERYFNINPYFEMFFTTTPTRAKKKHRTQCTKGV